MKRESEQESEQTRKVAATRVEYLEEECVAFFSPTVFTEHYQTELREGIAASMPYRWGCISPLMDDALLRAVREEVTREIVFTLKETDIYKVHQSGDLANLSGLDWADLKRLPSLAKLRAAIYLKTFRDYVSDITGCGPLLGIETDMSINTYLEGCHLLTHDDVIGTRRVLFILYMPEPGKTWEELYGGALRLFPLEAPNVPSTDYSAKLVPQFNQMALFKVQPGVSFHDVEEVREDRQRLSIQGWFHIPHRGEEGFVEGEREEVEGLSTLEALESKALQAYDRPHEARAPVETAEGGLTQADLSFLARYLDSKWLEKDTIAGLGEDFADGSLVEIEGLLKEEVAEAVKAAVRRADYDQDTPQTAKEVAAPWKVAVPPHKHRFLYVTPGDVAGDEDPAKVLLQVVALFRSEPWRKFLKAVTQMTPTSELALARRFRPGHDFTLAAPLDVPFLLEATLCLTPSSGWSDRGGYELYMATEDDDDDAAVYRAGGDDSVLHTAGPRWNVLTLSLREKEVLKFVKYVSWGAKGSRWDVTGAWEIDEGEEEEEVGEEEEEGEEEDET